MQPGLLLIDGKAKPERPDVPADLGNTGLLWLAYSSHACRHMADTHVPTQYLCMMRGRQQQGMLHAQTETRPTLSDGSDSLLSRAEAAAECICRTTAGLCRAVGGAPNSVCRGAGRSRRRCGG